LRDFAIYLTASTFMQMCFLGEKMLPRLTSKRGFAAFPSAVIVLAIASDMMYTPKVQNNVGGGPALITICTSSGSYGTEKKSRPSRR
jgi:hypothetical protein